MSPRGKVVYLGLEGLASTNKLIHAAKLFAPQAVLREHLYRVAVDEKQRTTLCETAQALPELAMWLDQDEKQQVKNWMKQEDNVLGALKMHNGCKVIHIPSYLQGLWMACQSIGLGQVDWIQDVGCRGVEDGQWQERLKGFDCVVFAAGAGLFQSSVDDRKAKLPIQLVRGQSLEMKLHGDSEEGHSVDAMLGGKYILPLPDANRVLIGATHEFKSDPLKREDVEKELRDRTYTFASWVWDHGIIDRITSGYRVQTNRGKHGRLPIIGIYPSPHHPNAWIFTGLSSRGLLYHGIFGEFLSDMILNEANRTSLPIEIDWWKHI